MRVYTVRRRVDAYVDYVAKVVAGDPAEAAQLAEDHEDELVWEEEGPCEFDDRTFVTLDANGGEIESSIRR